MKRKVNRVGVNTLTVSLPSKWAQKYGIEVGDELEITEENGILHLGTEIKHIPYFIDIDLTGFGSMLNRSVAALYKAGFNNAIIKYASSAELNVIQNQVDRSLHTFEVLSVKNNKIEIKSISKLDPNNFENVFRKMGYGVIDMAEDTYKALIDKNYDKLAEVIIKDKIVDRHTDFIRRILNQGHKIPFDRPCPVYVIAEQSEILADIFKLLCKFVIKNKPTIPKDTLFVLKEINVMIKLFYKTLNEFTLQNSIELGKIELKIRSLIDELCKKPRKDTRIICDLNNIFETAFEMKSALLTMNVSRYAKAELK